MVSFENMTSSLLVTVLHSVFNVADVPLKTVQFLQAAFDRLGERLLAVDQRGNVYVFDLIRNKFVRVSVGVEYDFDGRNVLYV